MAVQYIPLVYKNKSRLQMAHCLKTFGVGLGQFLL